MSDTPAFGFGNFVPGFDFLKTLTRSAAGHGPGRAAPAPGMPDWSQWVAPTLQVEEIDKRIGELKTVQFWLEQNARALAATIQALEVQKMTLDTLKGMNVQMSDLAGAFGFNQGAASAPEPSARGAAKGAYDDMFTRGRAAAAAAGNAGAPAAPRSGPAATPASAQAAAPFAQPAPAAMEPPASPAPPAAPAAAATAPAAAPAAPAMGGSTVDPLQWWNALTGQFQQIAASALEDAARHAQSAPGAPLADAARRAFDAAAQAAAGTGGGPVKKTAARKAAAAPRAAAAQKPAGKAAAPRGAAAAKKTTRPGAAPRSR
ncbi:MAG: PhaM family polyhydroxyalkanoate granule multifunctional regulatory protein [Pseudomonadota bacterium]